MTGSLVLLTLSGGALVAVILVLRYQEMERVRASLVSYRLDFPRDLAATAVVAFLGGLAGLLPSWRRRVFALPVVVLELRASADRITHHLLLPAAQRDFVLGQLRAALPGVRLTSEPPDLPRPTLVRELALTTWRRPLRTEPAGDLAAGALASLQPLAKGEQAVVQWLITPALPVAAASRNDQGGAARVWQVVGGKPARVRPPDPEGLKARRAKQAHPLFLAVVRLGTTAPSPQRAHQLMGRLSAGMAGTRAPGVRLRPRSLPSAWVRRRLVQRRPPLVHYPNLLNAAELAVLVGWPIGTLAVPGLDLGTSRQLPASPLIPSRGRVLGRSSFAGAERPLALSATGSLRHLHVLGPTGVGKSTLLLNLITADMQAGHGLMVIDPKGDLITEALDRVPRGRENDVIVLDPTDERRPVGLNILDTTSQSRELVADRVVAIFHHLFAEFWGPRTDDILRAALLTLLHQPGMTLCEVPLLLTNDSFRRRLVARVDDPVALEPFWAWYDHLSPGERAAAIGPVMNKLRAFLLRGRVRNVVGQAEAGLQPEAVLRQNQLLFVSLAKPESTD